MTSDSEKVEDQYQDQPEDLSVALDQDLSSSVSEAWWLTISPPEKMPEEAPWFDHTDLTDIRRQTSSEGQDGCLQPGQSRFSPALRFVLMLLLGCAVISGYVWIFERI